MNQFLVHFCSVAVVCLIRTDLTRSLEKLREELKVEVDKRWFDGEVVIGVSKDLRRNVCL